MLALKSSPNFPYKSYHDEMSAELSIFQTTDGFEILQNFIVEYNLTAHCHGKTAQLLRSIQHGRLAYAIRAIRYRIVKK